MVAFEFIFAAFCVTANGFLLSERTDFRDYDAKCIAGYLNKQHNFNISFKPKPDRFNYCGKYIKQFDESFYESIGDVISTKSRRGCVVNLMKRHRISDVFFKAIAYNYFKRQLIKFPSNKTCASVANVLRVDNDCEYREMTVEFIGRNKSLWKLRPCLDDLFGEFNVDEIVVVNLDARVGFRRFGRHLSEFMRQLADTGKSFCSDLKLDFVMKYFAIKELDDEQLKEIYNQTQIECFQNFFINHDIMENSAYQFYDTLRLSQDAEHIRKCDEIMQEQVESVIEVDLFGFTKSSQRVKDCIVEENARAKLIEQVIILPAIERLMNLTDSHFETPQRIFKETSNKIIELSLMCLRFY